ncbi:hypothetical protein NYO67_8289 [Aspergillus flavus]|nr:hypothetical protein NYO67_8289 [Aspergillus flavus]
MPGGAPNPPHRHFQPRRSLELDYILRSGDLIFLPHTRLITRNGYHRERNGKLGSAKWLQPYLKSLNPETEWEEIVRTLANYTLNEFILNISYVSNFILVIQEPLGSEALVHTEKVFDRKQERFVDSVRYFTPWFIDGPSSERVRKSISSLNNTHMRIAKRLPGRWDHDDDFIMPCVQMALFGHNMKQRLGVPVDSPHIQAAWHRWCKEIFNLFLKESGPVAGFPEDFQGMVEYSNWFNRRSFKSTEKGHLASVALIQQFCERWFPRPLHFVGYEIIITFLPDETIDRHRLGPRKKWLEFLIMLIFRIMFWLQAVLPDPKKPCYPYMDSRSAKRVTKLKTTLTAILSIVAVSATISAYTVASYA